MLGCIERCTDLLQRRASEDVECALRLINGALQISACSEKLLQMKADSLFMVSAIIKHKGLAIVNPLGHLSIVTCFLGGT